jgi:selenocysteine lyase/cysteine desulfurase
LHPLENLTVPQLFSAGSDDRLLPDARGLNRYGCGLQPRRVLALGSCTASSPSPRGYRAAETLLAELQSVDRPQPLAEQIWRRHRRRLADHCGLPSDVDVAFLPSGTDAETLVLALVRASTEREVVNVLVGPGEIGGGSPRAAAGRYYSSLLPSGRRVLTGQPVHRQLAHGLTLRSIELRDRTGRLLPPALIDDAVTAAAIEAADEGAHVLVHRVVHSKTGVTAPSEACLERIRRHLGPDVSTVIDAAQGRLGPAELRSLLDAGHPLILSGSKFFGGPPFAGALLVPAALRPHQASRAGSARLWRDGLADYVTAGELPETWSEARRALPPRVNYGALLRWQAALAEMDAYFALPPQRRAAVLGGFAELVPSVLSSSPRIELVGVPPSVRDLSADASHVPASSLSSHETVFSFRVRAGNGYLAADRLNELHRDLNEIPGSASGDATDGVETGFHLGQPVCFGDGSAALRIALGAPLAVQLATDTALGRSLKDRLAWLRGRLEILVQHLERWADQRVDTPVQASTVSLDGWTWPVSPPRTDQLS